MNADEVQQSAGSAGGCDTKKVYVPGERAPTVSVPGLWNSFGRHLTKCGGTLASFYQSMCSTRPCRRDDGSPGVVVWPIPIPFAELFTRRSGGPVSWKRRRLCLQIVMLDWLWLGRPSVAPLSICLGQKLTSKQWRTVRLLEHLSEDENSRLEVDAASMGRVASKTETSSDEISALHRAVAVLTSEGSNQWTRPFAPDMRIDASDYEDGFKFGDLLGEIDIPSSVSAKPIQADRITFVGTPSFDPQQLFDKETFAAYDDPLAFATPADQSPAPPVVRVLATEHEKIKLFKKLACTGRLQIFHPSEVFPDYAAGVFAVIKDLERDRLILDARPCNLRERSLNTWCKTLASAHAVSLIELDDDKVLLCSGQDLRDYFYQFRVSRKRAARNIFKGALNKQELNEIFSGDLGGFSGEIGFVGLNTLAMGDLCACEFAQAAHVNLLLRAGVFSPAELIQHRCPYPRGLLGIGIVIDDLVGLEQVLKSCYESDCFRADDVEMGPRMTAALDAYSESGLLTNPKKSFSASAHAAFWGCEVDGVKGTLRSSSTRFWPLFLITMRTACLGLATAGLLSSLAGSWISVFLIRRRLMSSMSLIFDAISHAASDRQVIRLSTELINELLTYCLLGSMCVVNLRAKTQPSVRATDSSDWGMAGVIAQTTLEQSRELLRHSLHKSVWSQMLPPSKAWLRAKGQLSAEEELPGDEVLDVHPLWELAARGLTYHESWRRPHQRQMHINQTELRAHLIEESRLGGCICSARQLYGLDSQVALGALVKGRCSSKTLNSELSRSIPTQIGCDLYGFYMFYPSAANRADGPTRGVAPSAPDLTMPHWWELINKGQYDEFDSWMDKQNSLIQERPSDPFSAEFPFDPIDETGGHVELDDNGAISGHPVSSLDPEALAILESFPEQQFFRAKGVVGFPGRGALDLYSGRAGIARALIRKGCPWVLSFDWVRAAEENLLNKDLQSKILRLIDLGCFSLAGSALICASFSKAVTPAVRSPRFPRGLPRIRLSMRRKVREGNQHADFTKEAIRRAETAGAHFWVENPDSSYLWKLRGYQRFLHPQSDWTMRVDFCRFGTPWQKRTRFGTSIPGLRGLRVMCNTDHSHLVLRGMSKVHRRPWTAVAEPYPKGLCNLVSSAAVKACGWNRGKLAIAACAKAGGNRIGEASNPGPRRRKDPRLGKLSEMPIQGAATLALGNREWDQFLQWSSKHLPEDAMETFLAVPLFLVHALRHYGDLQYQAGSSLSYFRHLILEAQRRVPSAKQYMSVAWDYATRWQNQEPTVHRQPLPLPILKAMVSLAWMLGWHRWVGVTLLSFFGIGRVGEVIKCTRKQLLLPSDVLESDCKDAYLVLYVSKTMFRQPAKIQHMKVTDRYIVRLLSIIFNGYDKSTLLFYGGAGIYRRRWNYLLDVLQVPAKVALTPGGLRGGGAVHAYRSNVDLPSLLWRMRIKHAATLEAYLQETAALTALSDLPHGSVERVKIAADFFLHLGACYS